MSTLGAFSSLLQLGFGLGIGLSLFRAPLTIRAAKIGRHIDGQLGALSGVRTANGKDHIGKLASLKLEFEEAESNLDKLYVIFFIFVLFGAAINLILLIAASIWPNARLATPEMAFLVFVSVGYYIILATILEVLTRLWLVPVNRKLKLLK